MFPPPRPAPTPWLVVLSSGWYRLSENSPRSLTHTLAPRSAQTRSFPYSLEGMVGRTRNSKDQARWILHSFAYGMQSGMSWEMGKERKCKNKQVCSAESRGSGEWGRESCLITDSQDLLNRGHEKYENRGGFSGFLCSSSLFHSLVTSSDFFSFYGYTDPLPANSE